MITFRKSFFSLHVLTIFLFVTLLTVPPAYGTEYSVTEIGDWSSHEDGTLAEALQQAESGDVINFVANNDARFRNWITSGQYNLLRLLTPLAPGGVLTFNMNGIELSGSSIDINTGEGTFVFNEAVLGSASDNLGVGVTNDGHVEMHEVDLIADNLHIGSTGTSANLSVTDGSSLQANTVIVEGYANSLSLADSTLDTVDAEITEGGRLHLDSNSSAVISGDLTVSGVGVHDNGGNFTYQQSTIDGTGSLEFTGDTLTVKDGAFMDMTAFSNAAEGYTVEEGKNLVVSGVFIHQEGMADFRTQMTLGGDLTIEGTATVADGALLDGVDNIEVRGGDLTVSGGIKNTGDNTTFQTELSAGGSILVSEGGTVTLDNGAQISGLTDITVGSGSDTSTLIIEGTNAATELYSVINAAGNLLVGDSAMGVLTLTGGGYLSVSEAILGGARDAQVSLSGVGAGNNRSTIYADLLVMADYMNASIDVAGGAFIYSTGNSIIGRNDTAVATVTVGGTGGIGTVLRATIDTEGDLTVARAGSANVTLNSGGSIISGGSTLAGVGEGSRAVITIDGGIWSAGGNTTDLADYVAPLGNTSLTVNEGRIEVSGLFAMSGQSYDNGFATATFNDGAELRMEGGSFYNMNRAADTGILTFNAGSLISGSGSIYAGDYFIMDGGTIAPGTNGMYDFNRNNMDRLTSLGTIHIYDNAEVATKFYNTTFETQLDRPLSGTTVGLADKAIIHGDLDMDDQFKISVSRMLDGKYLIVQADGGAISGFSPVTLSDLPDGSIAVSLNGKSVKGNDRVDRPGGFFTTLENGNEIWLTVDTTSGGNVKTWWTGLSDTTWDMKARNFDAHGTFDGNDQFLDGDIVVFDYALIDPGKRVVDVTTDNAYIGNLASVPNVIVAEMQILGGSASDQIIFSGGSIYTYDSALYSTMDQVGNGETPSGKLIKIGEGEALFYNANEFYGGVHLGETGTTGGTVVLHNPLAFGTYNSMTGYQNKGMVFVHEDTVIDVSNLDGLSINNRFTVDDDVKLTFEMGSASFSISNNNALSSNAVDSGKGGGIFISERGEILYVGTGLLNVTNNEARYGGGIYSELSYQFDTPLNVSGNYSQNQAGGIYAENQMSLRSGSTVDSNAAQRAGGGIYLAHTDRFAGHADFAIYGNSTVTNNMSGAEQGGGVFVESGRDLDLITAKDNVNSGGDIWFEGNYVNVGFNKDDPVNMAKDLTNASLNAVHLSSFSSSASDPAGPARLNITGPYNTYFYDPISGDVGTQVNITGIQADAANSTGLASTQYGTAVFHGDSAFFGDTTVSGGGTLRLESYTNNGTTITARYGRKGSLAETDAQGNTFTLASDGVITGSGSLVADLVNLNGTVQLDTGFFSRPGGRDGSGGISAADASTRGELDIYGNVVVEDTALWMLNLFNPTGKAASTDLIKVSGGVDFTGTTDGEKLSLEIDDLVHGRYLLMTSTGQITGYNADTRLSDAHVWYNGRDLAAESAALNADYGRLRVTTYTDSARKNLYLDVAGRNRHVTASSGGTWGYDASWTYDSSFQPVGTGSDFTWTQADTGPATSVYLDGDMVTLTGGTYNLAGTVNPVDIFIEGDVTFTGSGAIHTFSVGNASGTTLGIDNTTLLSASETGTNDYDISKYTGKLYLTGNNTLTFNNNGANYFAEGIVVGDNATPGGTLIFNSGNQLLVGNNKVIDFVNDGILNAIATTTLNTAVVVEAARTATFDINSGRTLTAVRTVSGDGAIAKTGSGTLKVSGSNSFAGGTQFSEGTLEVANNKAFGTYTGSAKAGQIDVTGSGTKTFASAGDYTVQNRFNVDGTATNGLVFNVDSGKTLTISGVNAGNQDGGAISIAAGAEQMRLTGGGKLSIMGNSANRGGGIFTEAADNLSITNLYAVRNNTAATDGGGIYAKRVEINDMANVSGNTADRGGAFFIAEGTAADRGMLSLNALNTNLVMTGNSANSGAAAFIDRYGDVNINTAGSYYVQFDNDLATETTTDHTFTKDGTGMVAFTGGNNNVFRGTTDVNEGVFRIGKDSSYGYSGSTGEFNVASGAGLTGGGTIDVGDGTLNLSGTISADNSRGLTVSDGDRIGTLNVQGNVAMTGQSGNTLLDVDLDSNGTFDRASAADLLNISGSVLVAGNDKININFNNYKAGVYKLIQSSDLDTGAFTDVDGINDNGAFVATVHDDALTERHRVAFMRGDESFTDDNGTQYDLGGTSDELWLVAMINNLYMTWTGAENSVWDAASNEANANWISSGTNPEKYFVNNDSVYFDATGINRTVEVVSDAVVTDMIVDGDADYIFTGDGGISTSAWFAGDVLTYGAGNAPQTLTKKGSGTLTLNNGANSFAGGTILEGGTIRLGNNESLGAYTTAGESTGLVTVTGDATIILAVEDGAYQNRFEVTDGQEWTLATENDSTVSNVASNGTGGAVLVGNGSVMNITNGNSLTFEANSSAQGANDIYLNDATLNASGTGTLTLNSGIAGTGTINKENSGQMILAADSAFDGTTNITDGEFRLIGGNTYGMSDSGSFNQAAGRLTGGGTISAGQITLNGTVNADSGTSASPAGDDIYGTLTFDGAATIEDGFFMEYNMQNNEVHDLLVFRNGGLTINGGTVNVATSGALTGDYLIMQSDSTINASSDINSIMVAELNGNEVNDLRPVRSSYVFRLEDNATTDSELWLAVQFNSLDMVWQTDGENNIWRGQSSPLNWLSNQGGTYDEKARAFANGDYVHFLGNESDTIEIDAAGVFVSGMEVASSGDYTFTGAGGITSNTTDERIEGRYLPDGDLTPTLTPDGKLTKSGSGTLTFENTGGNLFEEGIEISAGTLAFNRADQLGDGGKGITVSGSSTLLSHADVELENNINIAEGMTVTFDTNGNTLTLDGLLSQLAGSANLIKDGAGTLILTNTGNDLRGSTVVSEGTLQANGAETLGENSGSRTVTLAEETVLEVVTTVDESLHQAVTGGGSLVKSGGGTLTLDNTNTYTGSTTISGGRLTAETVGAVNGANDAEIILADGTFIQFKLDGAAESGTVNKEITGEGTLEKTGDAALTLTNAGNSYTGNTIIYGGLVTATHVDAAGSNVAAGKIDMRGADTSFELNLTEEENTFNQYITGSGSFIKSGTGDLTLTHANDFTGGTQWNGGNLTLKDSKALSAATGGAGSVAGYVYVNNGGTVTTDVATLQNRFEVAAGKTLTFDTDGLTIEGNNVGANGGAIELKNGATLEIGGYLNLINNTTTGSGGAIYAPDADFTLAPDAIASLTGNRAGGDGGGIYAASVSVNAVQGGTTITGNTAGGNGGAFYLTGASGMDSSLDTTDGYLTFRGNTAAGKANAIHMDQNVTLDINGAYSLNLYDGISSSSNGTGNLINIGNTGMTGFVNLYGDSEYYGSTEFMEGVMALNEEPDNAGIYAVFGRSGGNNTFRQYEGAVLSGNGTIGADSIILGGTVNAGTYTTSRRRVDIGTLGFDGDVTIGSSVQRAAADANTILNVDLRANVAQNADLMDITGGLNIAGESNVDLSSFVRGKFLLAATTDGITGYHRASESAGVIELVRNIDFYTTIAGNEVNTNRFNLWYTIENNGRDLYLNSRIDNAYIVWHGGNGLGEESPGWAYNGNSRYNNQWLNNPLYNWESGDGTVDMRYRLGDYVAFDSVSDIERVGEAAALRTRENIEIVSQTSDDILSGTPGPAYVADMLVTGGGTYRFTGQGIRTTIHSSIENTEKDLRQLYITGESTVVFANGNGSGIAAGNEGNNFERGIVLQNGSVAFDNANQLETNLNGHTSGIIVEGNNSYGEIIANADNMTLAVPIEIQADTSEIIINTNGNNFGNDNITGSYTLTSTNSEKATSSGHNDIHGAGMLVKQGEGTLILADANSYSGPTLLEGGTLAVAADNRLGQGTDVVIDNATFRAMDTFTTTRTFYLTGDGGTMEVDYDKVLTVDGVVTDLRLMAISDANAANAGELHKDGEGTLVFTNQNNDYNGDTYVDEGRLIALGLLTLGENSAGKKLYTLNDDGIRSILELNINDNETLHQLLEGDGEVIKSGTGTLNLEGTSDYAGRLTVQEGTLDLGVADFSSTDSFIIRDGGTLVGTGSIGSYIQGKVEAGGKIAPGGVVADNASVNPTADPLTVVGNLTFESGSTYEVVITQYPDDTYDPENPGRMRPVSDLIIVNNGTVTIEDGANLGILIDYWDDYLYLDDFNEDTSGVFTVIDAEDGTVDDELAKFNLLEYYLPRGVSFIHGWNGSYYQLELVGTPILCTGGNMNHNQWEVCSQLDQLNLNRDQGMTELLRLMAQRGFDEATLLELYSQLSGDLRINGIAMSFTRPWRRPYERLTNNLYVRPYNDNDVHIWSEVYGEYADIHSDGNSYKHTVRSYGFSVGAEKQFTQRFSGGLAFNYSNPELKQDTGKVEMDNFELGVYAMTELPRGIKLKSYAGLGHQEYDMERRVNIPAGGRYDELHEKFENSPNGSSAAFSMEVSRPWYFGDFTVSPVLEANYQHVWADGYTESGGITALSYEKMNAGRFSAGLGGEMKYSLGQYFDLSGRLMYSRVFNNETLRNNITFANATTETNSMDIWGVNRGQDYFNLNLNTELYIDRARTKSFFVNYKFDLSERETGHSGNIGFTARF